MHHFPWKMTDNVYEQKLGCIEEFMDQTDKLIPGPRQHLSAHGFLRLQFMPSRGGLEYRLRRAWHILRGSAPALTAVVCDGKKVLSQMDKVGIDAWAEGFYQASRVDNDGVHLGGITSSKVHYVAFSTWWRGWKDSASPSRPATIISAHARYIDSLTSISVFLSTKTSQKTNLNVSAYSNCPYKLTT